MQETVGEKTKTGDSYQAAQEMDEKRKTSLEKTVATKLLKLAMETPSPSPSPSPSPEVSP